MAEVLVAFEHPIADASGSYQARAVGRQGGDGMWEGWLEFESIGAPREILVTSVESRQPEKVHLVYWATGLLPIYLEGALARARNPTVVRVRVTEPRAESDGPAPRFLTLPAEPFAPSAVLDPFEIGRKNLGILDQELRALDRSRLLNIISAYQLNPAAEDLSWLSDLQLVRFIVTAVDAQLALRARESDSGGQSSSQRLTRDYVTPRHGGTEKP